MLLAGTVMYMVAAQCRLAFPCVFQLFPLSGLTSDLPHSIPVLNYSAAFQRCGDMCSSHPFESTNGKKRPSLKVKI